MTKNITLYHLCCFSHNALKIITMEKIAKKDEAERHKKGCTNGLQYPVEGMKTSNKIF